MPYNLALHAIESMYRTDLFGQPLPAFVPQSKKGTDQRPSSTIDPETGIASVARALSASAAVSSFTLINADTDKPIAGYESLASGVVLNLATLPTKNLNILANTTGTGIGSVKFRLDSNSSYRIENAVPYALAADDPGPDYFAWTPSVGSHTLGATVYSQAKAAGTAGATKTITFTVTNTPSNTQTPYLGSAVAIPGKIEAEDYDKGGEGVAYHDVDPTNVTGSYRSDGVDIEPTSDTGGGYNVGHIQAGEWLEYTINVPTAGAFNLSARVASGSTGGTFHVDVDGTNKTGAITLPYTGDSWQSWTTVSKSGISLTAGTHVLRVTFDTSASGGDIGNFNSLSLLKSTTSTPLPWPSSWQTAKASPIARFEPSGHMLNGMLYVFGGFKNSNYQVTRRVDVYDPSKDTWTQLADLPAGMAETHLAVTDDGSRYIYFVGGFAGDLIATKTPSQTASNKVWRFDTTNKTWSELTAAKLPFARGAGGLALIGTKLHYFGGNPADRVTNLPDHIVFDLNNPSAGWTTAAAMPNPKDHFSTVVLNGKIYALGGEHGHDQLHEQQSDMHVYDPSTNKWTQLASLPIAKSHLESATFVYNGQIVAGGGQIDNNGATASVFAYDPSTNAWSTLTSLPAVRQGTVMTVVGKKVILTDGAVTTDGPLSTTWTGTIP